MALSLLRQHPRQDSIARKRKAAALDSGFLGEVLAGAPRFDAGCDFCWLMPAGWGVPFRSGITLLTGSRDLLDWHVRRRLSALPRVRILAGTEATGLLPTGDGGGVRGVLARSRQ